MSVNRFKTPLIIHYLVAQSPLLRFGLAALTVAIAAIATHTIPVIGERAAFLLFFFSIIQTAFWLGLTPGILAMTLSLIAVNALVLFPAGIGPYDVIILNAGFCFVSAVMIATTSFNRLSTEALWESRQDLDYAQAVGQIGSWRLNVQRNELRWSDENHRIFGIPKGTPLTYETFLNTVHPDDRNYVDRMWQDACRGQPYDIEHRLMVAGEVKWVREKAVLELSNKGILLGGFGTTQDISDRKLNELALEESKQRFAGIVESAMDAIITIDADQRILLFNAAAEKMFDCKADEAIGLSIEHFITERFRTAHGTHIHAFGGAGTTIRKKGELRAVTGLRANGEEFPIEASISQCEIDGVKSFTAVLRDVTERERVYIVLKDQLRMQDQLVKVAATVPGLICSFRLRPDGTACMPYASPVIESVYGFSHEVVAEDFSQVFARIHSEDIGHIHETIAESARTMLPWRDAYRYNHPAKGEVWHEGHSIPLRETDGSILWHGYILDVTERKQAEVKLQEHIARYELVLDGAQDAIWDWDVPNKRVHYSSRWKALRGFAENEVDNDEEVWSANIHPDDSAHVLAAVQSHFEGKTPVFCEEYRIRCKDGSWKWILDRGICQRDKSGQVIRMAGSESDITSRKLAETALRDRENELRLIMNSMPALISYLDTNFRYLRVNATYENWFGVTPEKILGHTVREIIGESAWNIVRPYIERAHAGETVNFDQAIPYENGKPRWIHASYIPNKDSNGTVKGIVVHIVDIEDRIQDEQKIALLNQNLQHRIEEMQVIFDTVPMGLCIANDVKCHHIRGNLAIEQMLGVPTGSDLSKSNSPMNSVRVMRDGVELAIENLPMQRAAQGELVTNHIIDIIRPDGQTVTVLSNASPLFNEAGEPRGAVGGFLDITALKRAEESLKMSQTQLLLFIEQAPLSIAMFDREMNYLVTSKRWIEEFGRGYDDLTGRNYYELNPEISAEWKENHRKAQAGEFLKNDEDLWIQADGSRHWLRWAAYPWTNQEGENGGIIISCEDITARRLAEEELRKTEKRLALIVEEVKAGYWDWDLNTDTVYLSPEWKQQIGFDKNELLNRWEEWECRLHPDDQALVLDATNDFIDGSKPVFEVEFRLRHKDGSYRWIHSRGGLLRNQNNHPYRMLGINLDITDFKKTRELSERRNQMEQSFRLSLAGQTVAAIAHELNQPLAAIASYADVALHMLQSGKRNPQQLSHVLESCVRQALRAGDVIRQLMTILHKGEAISEPVDISISVRDAVALVKADIQLGAFKIETDLQDGLPQVSANALQIQKVLINLLRNGLESMQESGITTGKITITTGRLSGNPDMAEVTVSDCGKGVANTDTLKTMFQPFYTTKPSGLGMGLAINRSLIEGYGGKMWAKQNASKGISVHFTLPFAI